MKTLFAWSLAIAVALAGAGSLLGDDKPKDKPKDGDQPKEVQKDLPKEKAKDGDKPKDKPKDGDKPKDKPKDGDKPKGGDKAKIKQAASPEEQFKKLDANGDGKLTAEEFVNAQVAALKQKAEATIKMKDANSDGAVTLEEFKAEPAKGKKGDKADAKVKGDPKPADKPKDK